MFTIFFFYWQIVHQSPSTPTTLRSCSLQEGATRPESSPLTSSTISQAGEKFFSLSVSGEKTLYKYILISHSFSLACSPSRNDGLPVITSVCSLSAGLLSKGALSTPRYGFVLFGSLNMCCGTVTLAVNSVFCALQSKKETACYSTEHTKKISDKWLP